MRENITPHQRALRAAAERAPQNTGLTPVKGDIVSYTKPLLAKGAAAQWQVRHVDPDGTLTLDLVGNGKRSTARFGVQAGKVTVVKRAAKAAGPTLKRDVNGKVIVPTDTVVWETEDGLSHHAGYVSERQDSDPIDIRVQPLGAAGDTYVVIAARRLRLAKVGNDGNHSVSDLIDMADALENPQPKAVSIPLARGPRPRLVVEDDQTAGAAVAPVEGPKFEVMSAAHHRNGVSGRGFYVGIVKHWGDLPEGEDPRLLQVIAVPEDDAPEDVTKITFENGSGAEIYVTDLMVIAKQGTVAFGLNSFRGDHFYAEARAIIIQTRADWDNQMLRLNL